MGTELFSQKEKDLLDYTINTRVTLISSLTKNVENPVPEKSADKILLANILDGLDRAIHTKAKLEIEDKQNKQQEEITGLVGDLLSKLNPKEFITANTINNNRREIPININLTDKIQGETVQGNDNITFDGFFNDSL